ncbi:hypothetical protein LCGC14_1581260 [marine sediment metagenome]|uniref:Uncharacterized protein n=1 Tax=marine sediment metagenome TaxID=412755 RepID=A0A0F9KXN0_9ZZZZ
MTDYKSEDLVQMIRNKYSSGSSMGNSYVVLEQVPDGTGMFQSRWIDVAVFGLWPSKDLDRAAFEVKVSRSDFIRELQIREKHRWVRESFHEFWFVAPKDVIQIEELPTGVGFMCPRGEKLIIKRHCVRNDKPKLDDALLAGFMRAAEKGINKANKRSEEEILAGSVTHQRLKMYQQAVEAYLERRKVHKLIYQEEDVSLALEQASANKQVEDDLAQLQHIADSFQREIASLFSLFALLANKSILASDKMGRHIISAYSNNPQALEMFTGKGKLEDPKTEMLEIIRKLGG